MKDLVRQVTESYWLAAVALIGAMPILFWPFAAEAVQHVVEFELGMFRSGDGIAPGFETAARNVAGGAKVLALFAAGLLLLRYFAHGQSVRAALAFDRASVIALVTGAAFIVGVVVYFVLARPYVADALKALRLDLPPIGFGLLLSMILAAPMFLLPQSWAWQWLAKVLGDVVPSADRARVSGRRLLGTFPVMIVAMLPLMVVHDTLNRLAVDEPVPQQIVMLTADSVVVASIAAVQGAVAWVTYRDVRDADR
jgi:hypothetical protein